MRKLYLAAAFALLSLVALGVNSVSAANPQVGVQLSDYRCSSFGSRGPDTTTGGWSGWVGDSNSFDPDCARVSLSTVDGSVDFRIGIQAGDGAGCLARAGAPRWTPWASEGGGSSGWATDSNAFDPDCVRIAVETRTVPVGIRIDKAKLAINLSDYSCRYQVGTPEYTGWSNEGGGWSGWATDSNGFDPDCYAVTLDSQTTRTGNVTVNVVSTDGEGLNGSWNLSGPVGKSGSGSTETYTNMPFGAYSIGGAPATINKNGVVYERLGYFPSSQNLGPTSPEACPTGQTRNYLTCQNSQCVQITDGSCGPSSCSGCFNGGGEKPTPVRDQVFNFFKRLIKKASAAYLCDGTRGCYQTADSGPNQCDSNTDCNPDLTPPPPPPPPPPAPDPTAITFTIKYQPREGAGVACAPLSQNIEVNQDAKLTASAGNGTYSWSQGGVPSTGSGTSFTTKFSSTGSYDVKVTSGSASTTCRVNVGSSVPPVSCSPATQEVYKNFGSSYSGEATITASAGTGTYSWSGGTGSNPTTGLGSTYKVKFDSLGSKDVTVTSGSSEAICKVDVLRGGTVECTDPISIYVSSPDRTTTWTITGPSPQSQTIYSSSKEYTSVSPGTYTIVPRNFSGYNTSVEVSAVQTLGSSCGSQIDFVIRYTPSASVLSCSPSSQSVARNGTANFSASGGTGNYSWVAAGGNPTSGTGDSFSTAYANSGTKYAYLDDGTNNVSCRVNVSSCPGNPTLVIDPASTSTTVGGTARFKAWYDADGASCGGSNDDVDVTTNSGTTWAVGRSTIATQISKGRFEGKRVGSTGITATYGGLTANADLDVSDPNAADFACTVNPNSIILSQNSSRTGTISCTPLNGFTGSISLSTTGNPTLSTMVYNQPTVAIPPNPVQTPYTFSVGSTPIGAYTMYVVGTSGSISHSYVVNVEVQPAEAALTVDLTADPDSGVEPLPTTLTAEVGGYKQGPIDYYFWTNCDYNGTSLAAARSQCGTPIELKAQNQEVKGVDNTYTKGGFRAFVIVERDGATASDFAAVNVNSDGQHLACNASNMCQYTSGEGGDTCGPAGFQCQGDGWHLACDSSSMCRRVNGDGPDSCATEGNSCGNDGKHLSCVGNMCSLVNGEGSDTCAAAGTRCGGGGALSCSPASQTKSVNVLASLTASGGSGAYEWSAPEGQPSFSTGPVFDTAYGTIGTKTITLRDSTGATEQCTVTVGSNPDNKHLSCVNSMCTLIDGEGEDTCAPEGVACSSNGSCTFGANPKIVKKGQSSALRWSCDNNITSCTITSSGSTIVTGGRTGTRSVSPDATTRYTLNCDSGEVNIPATVYVVQSYQEVPPGGN